MSDFDAKFMQDEELRALLREWNVPPVPGSLHNRVATAYQQSMRSVPASESAFYPQRDSEVVNMNGWKMWRQETAERFSFCPVDGTPLSAAPAPVAVVPVREPETS